MKAMKTRNSVIISITLLLTALVFYSCDTIALGSKVNVEPPIVTITSPNFMENIKGNLTINGTASDLEEVVYLYVSIETNAKDNKNWKKEFVSNRGSWSDNSPVKEGFTPAWTGLGKGLIAWSLVVPMDSATEGEYIISASAVNIVMTAGPVTQQRVVIDKSPPVVKINQPFLDDTTTGLETKYKLKDTAVLDRLHSRNFKIQYEVDDNFSIADLEFQLTDSAGKVYYTKKATPAWNGSFMVNAADLKDPGTGNPLTARTNLQILSTAIDKAGNSSVKKYSHGWLVWCPDADIPWVEGVGGPETSSVNGMTQVYPGSPVYGQAYAKQGVKQVTYKIWRGTGYNSYPGNPITEVTLPNTPLEGSNPTMLFSFKFYAPNIPETRYRVGITIEDIYGKVFTDTLYFYEYENKAGNLLMKFEGTTTGLYGLGKVIEIILGLREAVTISANSTISLNITKPDGTDLARLARLDTTTNGTDTLRYTYTVAADDTVKVLKIKSTTNGNGINYASLTKVGSTTQLTGASNDLNNYTNPLEFYNKIEISTDVPVLNTATLSGTTLTLMFSKSLFKGTGDITLTQTPTTSYRASAVLTKNEYSLFGGSALSTWYTAGINGTDSSGNPDTTEKYILNFNTAANTTALITALTNGGAFKVTIPVVSSSVTVSDNSLQIDLSGGYAPRVKGVDYAITYPAGLVRDNQNNQVQALTGTSRTFTNSGVNPPFIRVDKKRETYSGTPITAQQPTTAEVKIDCQTPTAVIWYTLNTITTASRTGTTGTPFNGTTNPAKPALSMPGASGTNYSTTPLPALGSATDTTSGYLYGIRAEARLTGQPTSAGVYEKAARSVIRFTNITEANNWATLSNKVSTGRTLQLWIRGGDGLTGESLTPGFPMAWNEMDFKGARLMTRPGTPLTDTGTWYWITWEVSTQAYFHFIAGTTSTAAEAASGPHDWSWGKNAWAFQHGEFPLYAGGSLLFTRGTIVTNPASTEFEFSDDFSRKNRQ